MSGDPYEAIEERNRHKEASLIRDKLEGDAEDERARRDSEADLIGTVLDEIEERKYRMETGDTDRKINAHLTASMMKMHMKDSEQALEAEEKEREADIIGCVVDEAEEAQRRQSLPVQLHDIAHAHAEAEIISKDPLRWELPPSTTSDPAHSGPQGAA